MGGLARRGNVRLTRLPLNCTRRHLTGACRGHCTRLRLDPTAAATPLGDGRGQASGNGASNMRARRSGSTWEIDAPAKLNLYLEVLGRRDDGFHELDTLMTPIRLFDHLRWAPADPADASFSLQYHPATPSHLQQAAPADGANLVWRAFQRLADTAGIAPWGRVVLLKRIPVQAGMGGASSDAAAALVLANQAWGIRYPTSRLAQLAAELGSDVPFFFAGGPAICRGRGERVEPVGGVPRLNLVVAKPPVGVSTPAAFAALNAAAVSTGAACESRARLQNLVDNFRSGAVGRAARELKNRLEDAATALTPWIAALREAFAGCSVLGHAMTGSGSAYFGVMRSAREAQRVARRLAAQRLALASPGSSPQRAMVFATATCQTASPPF
jgi:4-diphosphocytidyl-2-C-methyl-D-erythritol kinase